MSEKKMHTRQDFKHGRTFYMTDETKKAYEMVAKQFKGCYPRLRWTLVNMSVQLLAKTIKEKKLKPGDDLEAALGI